MPQLQYRAGPSEYINKADNDKNGIVEAYVSVFGNVDSYKDRVVHGAFARSLKTRTPQIWLQHDHLFPLGKHLDAAEVKAGDSSLPDKIKANGGLWVKGHFNLDVGYTRDAHSNLKFGALSQFSFGFEIVKSEPADDGVQNLLDLELWEWSPVSIGANPLTSLDSIKSLSPDDKAALRDLVLRELSDHAAAYADMRQKAGRVLSTVMRDRFGTLADGLRDAIKSATACEKDIRQILRDTEPAPKAETLSLAERQRRLKLRATSTL